MLIRQKDGLYAGQVRDFPEHIAHQLIAAGRAVNPFHEIEDAPAALTAPTPHSPLTPPARRRGSR